MGTFLSQNAFISQREYETTLGIPGTAAAHKDLPTSVVELSIKASDLADRDVLSMSDAFCVVYENTERTNSHWVEIGRTEVIKKFSKSSMGKENHSELQF